MSMTEIPQNTSRREMRKALIRLRMEMHRQEIRHESQQLMAPLHKMRNMRHNWQDSPVSYTHLRAHESAS